MRVKRYIVNALPEALPMIRSELGKDAVILNTKEIRVGGFLGMFKKKKMEVIAAVESNGRQEKAAQPRKQPPAEYEAVISAINETVRKQSSAASAQPITEPVPNASAAATAVMDRPLPSQALNRINDELMDEIRVIKQSLLQLQTKQPGQEMPVPLKALYERLTEQEVEPDLIRRLLDELELRRQEQPDSFDEVAAWNGARELITEWMTPYCGELLKADARVVHFVGPTGVGKTTTIAKLAAEQTIKLGRRVGFVTSDTYRIAAVDQLRTYANILNVPIEVVFSPMDLPKAFVQLEDRELIYMDTAGRNFRNELHVSEAYSLLQTSEASETVLVLSLTGKTKDMTAVADNFVKYGVGKALYTKLDETSVFGSILNLTLQYGLKPTYVGRGQNVPDDIAPFELAGYVSELLGAPGP
ncbi:flagellar biosynthesis protein FlhF [Paenibacillus sp. NPDC058071]|uniref:flagellar biosynthesis protein FlhF n=1 Tax=Paenibacillus sp. NPDC058071 TaxID=3346326 RepID=UPI0036D8EB64